MFALVNNQDNLLKFSESGKSKNPPVINGRHTVMKGVANTL